ncbi:MAG: hypothetical protein JWQ96_2980, partial [Segetibacter sp.]|nr:hypothetical protein [Segetibacter sp.]
FWLNENPQNQRKPKYCEAVKERIGRNVVTVEKIKGVDDQESKKQNFVRLFKPKKP